MNYATSLPMGLDSDAIAKVAAADKKPLTEVERLRSRQGYLEALPRELERITDLIRFHEGHLARYAGDVEECDQKIKVLEAGIAQLTPLSATRRDVLSRVDDLRRKVERVQETRGLTADAVTKHQRIFDDNKRRKAAFPMDDLKEFLATEKILATVNL